MMALDKKSEYAIDTIPTRIIKKEKKKKTDAF